MTNKESRGAERLVLAILRRFLNLKLTCCRRASGRRLSHGPRKLEKSVVRAEFCEKGKQKHRGSQVNVVFVA